MTNLDPEVEIPKLTDKHRIRYRRRDAPESVESGLYLDDYGYLSTMAGTTVRFTSGRASDLWRGEAPHFILEAVIQPAFTAYRGMLLEDVDTKELWVYDPIDEGMEWIGTASEALSEAFIAARFAKGELVVFTPEVPA